MGMFAPYGGLGKIINFIPADSSTQGTTITAGAGSNNKGAFSGGQLIASTAADCYGMFIRIGGTSASNTDTSMLLDIGIGASGSETVLINNLNCGYVKGPWAADTGCPATYFFPIFVPSGTRISARGQSAQAADTVQVMMVLYGMPSTAGAFVGQRVTTYGADTATSKGQNATSSTGTNAYGTAVQITASTTNPIKYMQVGVSGGAATLTGNPRIQAKITADSAVVVEPLWSSISSSETLAFDSCNDVLSRMGFNIDSGKQLQVTTMSNVASTVSDWIIYGVD